jgi:integrase
VRRRRCASRLRAAEDATSPASSRPRSRARFKAPKSRTSRRVIPLAPECVTLLRSHKAQQDEEKARAGTAYTDNDLVFPKPRRSAMASGHVLDAVRKARQISRNARISIPRSASRVRVNHACRRCVDQRSADAHGSQLSRRDALRLCAINRRSRTKGGQRARPLALSSGKGLSLR